MIYSMEKRKKTLHTDPLASFLDHLSPSRDDDIKNALVLTGGIFRDVAFSDRLLGLNQIQIAHELGGRTSSPYYDIIRSFPVLLYR